MTGVFKICLKNNVFSVITLTVLVFLMLLHSVKLIEVFYHWIHILGYQLRVPVLGCSRVPAMFCQSTLDKFSPIMLKINKTKRRFFSLQRQKSLVTITSGYGCRGMFIKLLIDAGSRKINVHLSNFLITF